MKRGGPKNIVASVQARLVERSRELGVEHQLTLARFAGERLLYRLSKSEFADRFILKGAALLLLWLGEAIRPTKDVDLLGFGDTSAEALKHVFVSLCAVDAPEDGLTFLAETVRVEAIREDQEYGGMRVKLMAMLGNVRIPLQIDVGAGDAVVPPPEVLDYPGLLDLPRARVRAYRPETSIAEKTEAMVRLALANSRMKDFFDIHRLAETQTFDGETMRLAIAATFSRRGIDIPNERPLALTREFAEDPQKKVQWAAFVRRTRRPDLDDLSANIANLDRFLWPVLQAAARGKRWPHTWSKGGPWKEP
jgi:predicted nucleotidyltransferase component of viral defense system